MKLLYHTDLTVEKWSQWSLCMQLANVGSEVHRIINYKKNGAIVDSRIAFERALELIDLSVADPKHSYGAKKEMLRVREALVDYFVYDNEYGSSDQLWINYFDFFAFAAAKERGV